MVAPSAVNACFLSNNKLPIPPTRRRSSFNLTQIFFRAMACLNGANNPGGSNNQKIKPPSLRRDVRV